MTSNEPAPDDLPHAPRRPTRSRKALIAIVLLSVALVAALIAGAFYFLTLRDAEDRIAQQAEQIRQQEEQIQEQRNYINKKDEFGAAVEELLGTAREFDGTPMATIVPLDHYEDMVVLAWYHRRDIAALQGDITSIHAATKELETVLSAASAASTTNTTGSKYESVIDKLGSGFVTSVIDNADSFCGTDVLACVSSDNPYTVHFDKEDDAKPYMTDWLRTGIAYHEFAHVLQMTNPEPTQAALKHFDDDETMADCYALTYLDGWSLDHTIWVSSYRYWEVSIGYGYTCNSAQREVIRDWVGQLGFHPRAISQSR